MSEQDFYRRQNADLLTIIHEISEYFTQDSDVEGHADDFTSFLKRIGDELGHHLEEEDKQFFLHLLNSHDRYTAKLTENYIREMGKLGALLEGYVESYSNPFNIRSRPNDFVTTTKHVEQFLNEKVNHDNTGFYGLIGDKH